MMLQTNSARSTVIPLLALGGRSVKSVIHYTNSLFGDMIFGKGGRGARPPWILKISAKKIVFSISSGKSQISSLLAP